MYNNLSLFDNWYQKQYTELKRRIFIRTFRDEDSFHDTYFYLRKFAILTNQDIVDYTPYFVMAYRSIRRKVEFSENRYIHPEGYFFQSVTIEDYSEEERNSKEILEKRYTDIINLVKKKYPADYRLFYLKMIEPCCSYRELELYTGISANIIRRKIVEIKDFIKKEVENETYDL